MWLSSLIICVSLFQGLFAATDSYYTAAIFEHSCFGTEEDSVSDVIETNLRFFKNAIQIAKSKGVDIIVFPEYGLFPYAGRKRLSGFMEKIPDPEVVDTTPCIEDEYPHNSILRTLSCMARNNSMFVVANMGDKEECEGNPKCPPDGVFHYNTEVVFNRNGKLLVEYQKEHLFFEVGLDEGPPNQNTVYQTEFGTFATYICFDVMFERMEDIARYPNIDGVTFSTKWLNIPPQLTSIQGWFAWALKYNVTFMAANVQMPGESSMGSGIFHPRLGAIGYTLNPDAVSKLIVAKIPIIESESFSPDVSYTAVTETDSSEYVENGCDLPKICTDRIVGPSTDRYTDYRCDEQDTANFTFVKLTEPSGHVEACDNGMCCTLDYSAEDMTENFYLAIINQTYFSMDAFFFSEETCFLVRCEPIGDNPCATFPTKSETVFTYAHLKGTFDTDLVYPIIAESEMRLTPISAFTFELPNSTSDIGDMVYNSQPGRKLITFGFKGRCRNREPFIDGNLSLKETAES